MNKARDVYDAEMAALESEHAAAKVKFAQAAAHPAAVPTSELLAMFVGLSVGGVFGMPDIVEGTGLDRDAVLGAVAVELDRRIPVPKAAP